MLESVLLPVVVTGGIEKLVLASENVLTETSSGKVCTSCPVCFVPAALPGAAAAAVEFVATYGRL